MRHRPTLDSLRPARNGIPPPPLPLPRRPPPSRPRQVRAVATNWASWLTVLALVSAGWRVAGAGAGATLLAAVAVAAGVTVLATGLVLSSLLWQRGLDELVRAGRTSVA